MTDSVGIMEKVRSVPQMDRPKLMSEWQAQFGAPPPPKITGGADATGPYLSHLAHAF